MTALLPLKSIKRLILAATLPRGVTRPVATKDEAPSIYFLQQYSLRRFELRMRWILTTQGGEFMLHVHSSRHLF